jgi:hypothetical protein
VFSALGFGARGVLAFAIFYSLTSRQWCGHHIDATTEWLITSFVAGIAFMINRSGCGIVNSVTKNSIRAEQKFSM